TIELDDEARKWLGEKGYDKLFGARPLARIIQEHVKKPLAEELLFGKLANGGVVQVRRDGNKLAFVYIEAPPKLSSKDSDEQPEQELVGQ
ncbi:MAG: ATP-dependent Clp protease ATP-binding subunit ClpA, partial [Candidatus Binataceae bacterium]